MADERAEDSEPERAAAGEAPGGGAAGYAPPAFQGVVPAFHAAATDLTVLILAEDGGAAGAGVVEAVKVRFSAAKASFEVLVLDGGRRDAAARRAARAGARVLRQDFPGYGSALRQGLMEARGKFILTMDAGGSQPVEAAAKLWESRDKADVIVGTRYSGAGGDRRPLGPRLAERAANLALAWGLLSPVTDLTSGLRLYRADALRGVTFGGSGRDALPELLARLQAMGRTFAEAPYVHGPGSVAARAGGGGKAGGGAAAGGGGWDRGREPGPLLVAARVLRKLCRPAEAAAATAARTRGMRRFFEVSRWKAWVSSFRSSLSG